MLPFRTITHTQLMASRAITNNATITSSVDCNGADYATVIVNCSSEVNTNAVGPTISLLESDITDSTGFATITADVTGDMVAAKPIVYGIDMRGRKRYLKLSISAPTATNDHFVASADVVFSRLKSGPSGTTAIVSTNGVARFV